MARTHLIVLVAAMLCTRLLGAGAAADEDDGSVAVPSGAEIEAKTRERFPGVRSLSLVKILRWPERSPGPCTADFEAGEGETRIDASWSAADGAATVRGGNLAALAGHGWTTAYRSPAGVGLEKIADFEEIDLTFHQTLVCRCFGAGREVERHPTRLRLRWAKGSLPEVSASIGADPAEGLRPSITAGRLVTYDFAMARAFPGGRGSCGGHLAVTLLVEPAIL